MISYFLNDDQGLIEGIGSVLPAFCMIIILAGMKPKDDNIKIFRGGYMVLMIVAEIVLKSSI